MLLCGVATVGVMAVGGVAWSAVHAVGTTARLPAAHPADATARSAEATSSVVQTVASASRIEVPDLVGMDLDQASTVLGGAGLRVAVTTDATAAASDPRVVDSQAPPALTIVPAGSVVRLRATPGRSKAVTRVSKPTTRFVVVIDPGHQAHADDGLEPIGPGSSETKPKATGGGTGVSSGVPEYEIDLEIATNLQSRLEGVGVKVVMTRTTNDVDISNVQRAQIANAAKADLFVRIHADSSTDPSLTGVATYFPAANQWTAGIVSASRRAAVAIDERLVAATGAADGGAVARSDLAGFNWSKVPSVSIQAGYPSNAVEDRLLTGARYQDEVAQGIADGIMVYLGRGQ